jgi:hypothetical protein
VFILSAVILYDENKRVPYGSKFHMRGFKSRRKSVVQTPYLMKESASAVVYFLKNQAQKHRSFAHNTSLVVGLYQRILLIH